MIHLLISIFLIVLFARIILRLIFRPFRRRYRNYGCGNPYGYGTNNPYGYGYRRPRFGGGILPIVILVALDRLFGRRF